MTAEHDRQIGQGIMIGVITEIDEGEARVRVDVDGLITDWLPFTAARAGPGVREWSAPEPGEQVVVVSPYGDPSQGVVLGSIYQSAYNAPAALKTAHRTEFADGAFIQYDREGHQYALDVPSGGAITLRIGGTTLRLEDGQATLETPKFVVDSPETEFTGNVKIEGSTALKAITSNGINISDSHKHGGVQPGSGSSGVVSG